jgi:hypothetical protein
VAAGIGVLGARPIAPFVVRLSVVAAAVNFSAFELPHFIMQRRMMLRIKELAERGPGARG